MSALTDFLLARITEDEAGVREATPVGEGRTFYTHFGAGSDDWGVHYFNVPPARVLADCEAKRRIVERELNSRTKITYRRRLVLQDLAAVYADHPDYREEWRP